ncbi:MAG: VWA domain-containing protein [Nitrospirota bacterium]
MRGLTHKTLLYGAAGALGGSAAWAFVLALSAAASDGLRSEILLGAVTGMFLGGFIWSHEALAGRQLGTALKRAAFGAVAGIIGGALGAGLGSTVFSVLGRYAAEQGGFAASFGIILAVSLGWAIMGAAIGISGGLMIRSRERARYGLAGGFCGGLLGGSLYSILATAAFWPVLAGLALLGFSIGALISLVEEAFVSAKVTVIKGRHLNREFPLLKEMNVIGRDDRSDVCLSGAEGVALQHADIKRNNGHYLIETDEQGKAVYVNQVLTRNSRLTDGDVIRVGSILLLFSAVKKAAMIAGVVLLAGLACSGALASEPASAQITQFDLGDFPLVRAYVSVLDADGKPVRGLTKESSVLLENGRPIAIDSMRMAGSGEDREPLSLAIVLDRSESMSGEKIVHAKESVLRFIALMEPGDKAALIVFSDTVALLEPLTSDQVRLTKAVQAVEPEGHTALYDAVARGAEALKDVPGRKAVVVLTDGIANRGSLDIHQAIAEAVKDFVSVTVIGLGADVRTARLERIAQETGGSYFFTPSASGLADIYEAVSRRIRNEYVVVYHTQDRADYLRNVSLTLGSGPTAMRSYFQPDSSLFGAGSAPPRWTFAMSLLCLLGLMAISFRTMERQYATGHLSLVRGRGTAKGIDIGKTVTIGADATSTLGLTRDRTIAQQHAEVVQENGRYVIEDKGAATGTFVNKKKVTGRQTLRDGDVIDVGHATIVFSEPTMQACKGCGEALRPGAKFCAKCGVRTA